MKSRQNILVIFVALVLLAISQAQAQTTKPTYLNRFPTVEGVINFGDIIAGSWGNFNLFGYFIGDFP